MHKVVINSCYGGFGLSFEAVAYIFDNMCQEEKYEMRKDFEKESQSDSWGIKDHIAYNIKSLPRHHKLLIKAVETFGFKANGKFSNLEIVSIKGDSYIIEDYDGYESVAEPEDMEWIKVE